MQLSTFKNNHIHTNPKVIAVKNAASGRITAFRSKFFQVPQARLSTTKVQCGKFSYFRDILFVK